jgi:Tc toxin complex TcA C-terminal TcB-binding domain
MSDVRTKVNYDSYGTSTESRDGAAMPVGDAPGGGGSSVPSLVSEPDIEMPIVYLTIDSPSYGETLTGPAGNVAIRVSGTASSSTGPVDRVLVQIGNAPYQNATMEAVNWYEVSWHCTVYAAVEGQISIQVIAERDYYVDVATGQAYSVAKSDKVIVSVQFVPDTTGPNILITSPSENQVFEVAGWPFSIQVLGAVVDPPNGTQPVSGVQQVEYSLNGGDFVATVPDSSGNWAVPLALGALGRYEVRVRGRDRAGNYSAIRSIAFTLQDTTAPVLEITESPAATDVISSTSDHVNVKLRCIARDGASGVASVQWSLDGGDFTGLSPSPSSDEWSAYVRVPTPSLVYDTATHTIVLRCMDHAGNMSTKVVTFQVRRLFKANKPISQFGYLSALIDYAIAHVDHATAHIESSTGTRIQPEELGSTFHQPFVELLREVPADVASEPLHQVRLAIEVLRDYLGSAHPSDLAEAERRYCRAAYTTLLLELGTSYDELRLARGAELGARSKLASRLGIPTEALSNLFLPLDQVNEQDLQRVFGLAETGRGDLEISLAATLASSQLLGWQKAHLRVLWLEQDDAQPTGHGATPVVDPDVVRQDELVAATLHNPALDLWLARQSWLEECESELRLAREGKPPLAGYKEMVEQTWAESGDPDSRLIELDTKRRRGERIDDALEEWQLTPAALTYLMKARNLAATDAILDAEWIEVEAILIQVQKQYQYATWREEERQKQVNIGPDFFVLEPEAPSELSAWRASPAQRRAWKQTLEARVAQVQGLEQALRAAVDAAAEAALPGLRDALCEAAVPANAGSSIADWLTRRLLVDMRAGGAQRTTRIGQAIEAMQAMLFGLRTQQLPQDVGWKLDVNTADFDADWQWMGSDETWRAAMQVFYYPDRLLLPSLRAANDSTSAFTKLIDELRTKARLTPKQAQAAADTYLGAVKPLIEDAKLKELVEAPKFKITEKLELPWDLSARASKIKAFFADLGNPHAVSVHVQEIFYFVPMALALQLQEAGEYLAALDWFQTVYAYHLPTAERKVYYGLELESNIATSYQLEDDWLRESSLNPLNPHVIAKQRANAYTRFTIATQARCYVEFADSEFTRATDESLPRARVLYMNALDLLGLPEMRPPTEADAPPPDPQIEALRQHASVNLSKLRNGRNIAGMQLQIALDPDAQVMAVAARHRPTPYRYAVLIERAKNLVTLAQQMEGAYLAALEKVDVESYNLLRARQELRLADASVELQRWRVEEALHSETLADRQRDRAQVQYDTYDRWLDAGLSYLEKESIFSMWQAIGSYDEAGQNAMRAAELGAITAGMSGALSGGQFGLQIGGALAGPAAMLGGILGAVGGAGSALYSGESQRASSAAAAASTRASILATRASQERRVQEWTLQRSLAERDVAIGQQQVVLAYDHTQIVKQEQVIANIQQEHARAVVDFLANKFTNVELYTFMAGVLGGVYRYFLQQATATAQLAQSQLAFERQEPVPSLIHDDYWQPPAGSTTGSATPDRRGLTGSARLLQDIYQLDQHAFDTNKRKLQLSQTFSLARLAPLELQRFRQTGVLPFATPMELFDRGFPGHYLRLIKRVRMSVVALIPPTQGIRATLINNGISRVVIGGDRFQTTIVRRDPEMIAFTSPISASGTFELDPQSDMLAPFESSGVDTHWQLEMPRASNPFDFDTIADVLMTIEYTALHSFDYRQQVIRRLDRTFQADRGFSLRNHFPDPWYDLHHQVPGSTPITADFQVLDVDFPVNVDAPVIENLMLVFARADGTTFEVEAGLTFTPAGSETSITVATQQSVDGVISTRRNAAWKSLIGVSPVGRWALTLPSTPEMVERFEKEELEDVLLMMSYRGMLPAWPQ